jgi:hypothetical protein
MSRRSASQDPTRPTGFGRLRHFRGSGQNGNAGQIERTPEHAMMPFLEENSGIFRSLEISTCSVVLAHH